MRTVWCCLLIACGGLSPAGTTTEPVVGPPGPPGPQGPPGAAAPTAYHWVDAANAVVTTTSDLVWIDPVTSWLWSIDPETGALVSGESDPIDRAYGSYGCLGDAYVAVQPPRVPFRIDGPGSVYVVRQDWDPTTEVCARSWLDLFGCRDALFGCVVKAYVTESHLRSTGFNVPPASGWIGPLRPEL